MKKIELKTIFGSVAFTWESENNTVKETVEKLLSENKGKWIEKLNLSDYDLSGIDFSNSKFYNSQFDNSKFYNSKFDNSKFDNSKFDNSQFYNSQFDRNSINSALESGFLNNIKMDFFGRMLLQKNEVPFLRDELIAGRINGSSYDKDCCCFVGTLAKKLACNYTMLPNLKPDANSETEKWFLSIRLDDTPVNSEVARVTLDWINEFLELIK